jgi:hypothetical protein
MKSKLLLLGLVAVLSNSVATRACGTPPNVYAQQALSTNVAVASNAVAQLRQLGSEGLNALLKAHEPIAAPLNKEDPRWVRLSAALDAVGGQRDCHASRLFWHRDFDAAKSEAQRTGKPILSLRLLGNLDEELSCANSRFFRTTLYANKEVSDYLRDHFVLHWKSVRPVPRITIDMGDGRKIERTITGNSIHYVLDVHGEVVDALPGLYGPRAFLAGLQEAERMAARVSKVEAAMRPAVLEKFHAGQLSRINQRWGQDVSSVLPPEALAPKTITLANGMTKVALHPAAAAAMPLAVLKSGVERPMLRALVPVHANLERAMTDDLWAGIAALHQEEAVLDQNSLALIRAKTRPAGEAMRLAFSKRVVEDPMLKTVQNLQRSIAEDTVRNEYTFHAKIHEWLATTGAPREVDALNRRVYAELFLTPDNDPWLGLAPADTFSALENGGLVQRSKIQNPKSKIQINSKHQDPRRA